MAKLEIDRHVDAPKVEYRLLVPEAHLKIVTALSKKLDRTRQSLFREAIREWVERRSK